MRRVLPFLVFMFLLLPACGDDDGSPSAATRVVVEVVDAGGEPVPGLELALWNDSPFLQDTGKAVCHVAWTQPIATRVRLSVEDVEGGLVRVLADGEYYAGNHLLEWHGEDTEDVHQFSGRYVVKLEGFDRDTGTEIEHTETVDIWMVIGSFRDEQCVGTTDSRGRIVLQDLRLFPHLYDRPAIPAYDEIGEYAGDIELDENMIFLVRDPGAGVTTRATGRVPNSRSQVNLVWRPVLPAAADAVAPPPPAKRGEPPLTLFGLRVYPNPFS